MSPSHRNTMLAKWALLACAIHIARAVPQAETTMTPTSVITGVPTLTQVTAIASPTAPLTATLPSQVPLPPVQAWCPSEIFCAGAVRRMSSFTSLLTFAFLTRTRSIRSCKPSISLISIRTQKRSSTSPQIQMSSPSWLHFHPSTRLMPPRVPYLTLSTITFAAKALNSRRRLSPTSMLIRLS